MAPSALSRRRAKAPVSPPPVEPITEPAPEAETANEPTPVVETPEELTPEVEVPEESTPEVEVPEEPAPEVEVPEEPTLEVEVPEESASAVETPEEPTLEVEAPEEPTPEVEAPEEPAPPVETPAEPTPPEVEHPPSPPEDSPDLRPRLTALLTKRNALIAGIGVGLLVLILVIVLIVQGGTAGGRVVLGSSAKIEYSWTAITAQVPSGATTSDAIKDITLDEGWTFVVVPLEITVRGDSFSALPLDDCVIYTTSGAVYERDLWATLVYDEFGYNRLGLSWFGSGTTTAGYFVFPVPSDQVSGAYLVVGNTTDNPREFNLGL
jgi:hypothetical protein